MPTATSTLFDVAFRSRRRKPNDVLLAQQVEVAVGIGERALADAPVAPPALAGVEIEAGQDVVREAVEVSAHQDDAAVVAHHLVGEIDLARVEETPFGLQAED